MTTSKPCATLSRVIQLLRTVFKRCCISCQDDNFTALCTSFNGYLAITIKKVKGERTLRIREPPFEKWSMYLSIAQIAFNPRPINIVRDIVRDGGSTAPETTYTLYNAFSVIHRLNYLHCLYYFLRSHNLVLTV